MISEKFLKYENKINNERNETEMNLNKNNESTIEYKAIKPTQYDVS